MKYLGFAEILLSILSLLLVSVLPAEARVISNDSYGSLNDPSWTCGRTVRFSPNHGKSTYYVTSCVGKYPSGQVVGKAIAELAVGPRYPGPCWIQVTMSEVSANNDHIFGESGPNQKRFNCIYGTESYFVPSALTLKSGAKYWVDGYMQGDIFWNLSGKSYTGWIKE